MNDSLHDAEALQAEPAALSPQGVARRDAMLGNLLDEAQRLRHRRAASRAAGVLGLSLLAAAGVWWAVGGSASPLPAPGTASAPGTAPAPGTASLADAGGTAGPAPDLASDSAPRASESAINRRVSMLDNDAGIVARLAMQPPQDGRLGSISIASRTTGIEPACRVEHLNDAQLARALDEMGQPATVARSRDRVWLIAHQDSADPRL